MTSSGNEKFLHILPNTSSVPHFLRRPLSSLGPATHPYFAAVGVSLIPGPEARSAISGTRDSDSPLFILT